MFPIEAFRQTLDKAVQIFTALGIRFHLTGGITTVFYGEPRLSQVFDIVVDNSAISTRLDEFFALLAQSDLMFDELAIRTAVESRRMFQLLDTVESLKLDVYPRELIPGELERSVIAEVFAGTSLPIASWADAAASKLVWISKGSHKSRRDLRQILRLSPALDRQLFEGLAVDLGLQDLAGTVLAELDEPLE